MEIAPEDRKYVTRETYLRLFAMNRLCQGLTDAPEKWQKAIQNVIGDVVVTAVIIDDVIVTGVDDNDHIRNLNTILMRLSEYGLRVNKDKCSFLQPKVKFCGHKASAEGISQEESKTKAIKRASKPENVIELKSFLGLENHYHKFIPNGAEILAPSYELTGVKWKCGNSEN